MPLGKIVVEAVCPIPPVKEVTTEDVALLLRHSIDQLMTQTPTVNEILVKLIVVAVVRAVAEIKVTTGKVYPSCPAVGAVVSVLVNPIFP